MKFVKIPNNFFHNEGRILEDIGEREGFVVYSLITILKNTNNLVYLNKSMINQIVNIDNNSTRSKQKIDNILQLQKTYGLIEFDDIINLSNNDFFQVKWVDLFEDKGKHGWIAFYQNDFAYYKDLGVLGYNLMWLLRTYQNTSTKNAFPTVSLMSKVLKCRPSSIMYELDKLERLNLFEIRRGETYTNKKNEIVNQNNTYKFLPPHNKPNYKK